MENKGALGKGRVYAHGNYWCVDYYFNRRRKRESVALLSLGNKGRKLAEAVLAKRQIEIAENKFLDIKRECRITFNQLSEKYLSWAKDNHASYEKSTVSYVKTLKEYFGNINISEISKEDLERFRNKRKLDKVGASSINHELGTLRRMFNLAIDKWEHPENKRQAYFSGPNPAAKFDRLPEKSRDRVLSKGELIRIISIIVAKLETEKHPRDHAGFTKLLDFILLAVSTGMRKGEIQGLKHGSSDISFSEIDPLENYVILRETKNGENRKIPLNKISGSILQKHFDFDYNPRKLFDSVCVEAKVKNLTLHDLRRSFATYLQGLAVDPFTIAALLGHKVPGLRVTSIYARVQTETMHSAIQKLEKYLMDVLPSGYFLGTGWALDSNVPKTLDLINDVTKVESAS